MVRRLPEDILRRIQRDGSITCVLPGHVHSKGPGLAIQPGHGGEQQKAKSAATRQRRIAEAQALIEQGWTIQHVERVWTTPDINYSVLQRHPVLIDPQGNEHYCPNYIAQALRISRTG